MDSRSPGTEGQARQSLRRCWYCGGALDLRYHFCVHCAAVQREPDPATYGDEAPLAPSKEARFRREGRPALNFFCLLAVGVCAVASVTALAGDEWIGPALICQDVFVAAVTVIFGASRWREIAYLFRGMRVSWPLVASVPVLALLLVVNKAYHDWILSLIDVEHDMIAELREALSPPLLFVSLCVFPAVFEEIGFRGVVQERLVAAGGTALGVLATSGLFVALHFSALSAPYLFVLSLFLCWIRSATRSVYPTIALHFLHNLTVLMVFNGGDR